MKKPLIIIVGIIILLVSLGFWVYLLLYGTPENLEDIYADLGIETPVNAPSTIVPSNEPVVPDETALGIDSRGLQQLTTRPVAGFGFVGTSSDLILYVEQGTGHVYEIDLAAASENRLSGTTIPRVTNAHISPNGSLVFLQAQEAGGTLNYLGTISTTSESLAITYLPENISEAAFIDEETIRYVVQNQNESQILEYRIPTEKETVISTVPFTDATFILDQATPYVYNKPSSVLPSGFFAITEQLEPITKPRYGLTAVLVSPYIILTSIDLSTNLYQSFIYSETSDQARLAPIMMLPEKCSPVSARVGEVWCASPFEDIGKDFLENWYQGEVQSDDKLWRATITIGEAILVSNLSAEAGRLLDIDAMQVNFAGTKPIFRNKVDKTLWLYDATP